MAKRKYTLQVNNVIFSFTLVKGLDGKFWVAVKPDSKRDREQEKWGKSWTPGSDERDSAEEELVGDQIVKTFVKFTKTFMDAEATPSPEIREYGWKCITYDPTKMLKAPAYQDEPHEIFIHTPETDPNVMLASVCGMAGKAVESETYQEMVKENYAKAQNQILPEAEEKEIVTVNPAVQSIVDKAFTEAHLSGENKKAIKPPLVEALSQLDIPAKHGDLYDATAGAVQNAIDDKTACSHIILALMPILVREMATKTKVDKSKARGQGPGSGPLR